MKSNTDLQMYKRREKMRKKKNEVVYYITVSDIQEVAGQEIDRELSLEEVEWVQNRVGDYISWYDAIARAIDEIIVEPTRHK